MTSIIIATYPTIRWKGRVYDAACGSICVSDAGQAQLFDLIRQLQKRQDTVGITRDGVPTAVLLSMEHFEGLMETLKILSDQKTMRPLRKSLKQAQSGRWETDETVFSGESE